MGHSHYYSLSGPHWPPKRYRAGVSGRPWSPFPGPSICPGAGLGLGFAKRKGTPNKSRRRAQKNQLVDGRDLLHGRCSAGWSERRKMQGRGETAGRGRLPCPCPAFKPEPDMLSLLSHCLPAPKNQRPRHYLPGNCPLLDSTHPDPTLSLPD